MGDVDFVFNGNEMDRPCTVEAIHSGHTMFSGLRPFLRLRVIEPSFIGAENDEPAVVEGLAISE